MAAGDGAKSPFPRFPSEVGTSLQHVTSDTTGLAPRVIGFVAKVAGVVSLRARYDSLEGDAYIDHPVAAGEFYPLDVRDIKISTSTASQEVTVYRVL